MARTRIWFPRDCQLTADPTVAVVGDEFGALGILMFEEVIALAKLADADGVFEVRYSELKRRTWAPSIAKTKAVVNFLEVLGLILFRSVDARGFVGEVTSHSDWNLRNDPTAADRQKRHRDKVTKRNVTSRDTDTDTDTGEGLRPSQSGRPKIDQDQLPADFPADLEPKIAPVLDVLHRVHDVRGGHEPTRRAVGLVVSAFPRKDHHAAALKLEHWATAGRGLKARRKDWAATLRTFLEGAEDVPVLSVVPSSPIPFAGGGAAATADRDIERMLAEAARLRAVEAASA